MWNTPEQPSEKRKGGGLFGGGQSTNDMIRIALSSFADSIGSIGTNQKGQSLDRLMQGFKDQRDQAAKQEAAQRQYQAAIAAGYKPNEATALQNGVPLREEPKPSEFERSLMGANIDPKSPQGQQLYQRRVESMTRDPGDEFIIVPLPGGTYAGPRSGLAQAMGANTPEPPEVLPPDFNFGQGDATGNRGGGFPRR